MAKACPVCFAPTPDGRRCPRHPRAHRPRAGGRGYSDTADYRRILAEVLEVHGAVCSLYCGEPIDTSSSSPDPLELAHVIPHADGGAFTPDNVRPAHRSCNRRAGRQPVMEV